MQPSSLVRIVVTRRCVVTLAVRYGWIRSAMTLFCPCEGALAQRQAEAAQIPGFSSARVCIGCCGGAVDGHRNLSAIFLETLGVWHMRLKLILILHQIGIKNDEVASLQEAAAVCAALKPAHF
jgi:hypothetical protein